MNKIPVENWKGEHSYLEAVLILKDDEIQKLKKVIELYKKSNDFYAEDRHIREYTSTQMVMLEASEIGEEDFNGNSIPNFAEEIRREIKEIKDE